MNQAIAREWARELKSGKWKQYSQFLQGGDAYCCLGVLCRLPRFESLVNTESDGSLEGADLTSQQAISDICELEDGGVIDAIHIPSEIREKYNLVPSEIREKYNLEREAGVCVSLVSLNDDFRLSFEDIGTIVEQAWEYIT